MQSRFFMVLVYRLLSQVVRDLLALLFLTARFECVPFVASDCLLCPE
jgi:hypothetical protein